LSVVNPCGFPLLPAFLSYYLGADEDRLPPAPTRILQGLVVGGLVAIGFLGLFAVVGLPLSLGVGAIADAVPWVGLATGVVLALTGLGVIAGRRLRPVLVPQPRVRSERRLVAMVLFGVGYGAASLGCTLPIFLALVGASLGADTMMVFVAYGVGMAVVLMALAVAIACARQSIAGRLRPLLPYVGRLAGVLLTASGAYLAYYWARIRFGNSVTLADDPIVGFASRYSAELQDFAGRHGTPLIGAAGAIVTLALASGVRHRLRRRAGMTTELVRR
jgi:cytochrome c biogenesis protein CcdA